jgi:hypothetical protein
VQPTIHGPGHPVPYAVHHGFSVLPLLDAESPRVCRRLWGAIDFSHDGGNENDPTLHNDFRIRSPRS